MNVKDILFFNELNFFRERHNALGVAAFVKTWLEAQTLFAEALIFIQRPEIDGIRPPPALSDDLPVSNDAPTYQSYLVAFILRRLSMLPHIAVPLSRRLASLGISLVEVTAGIRKQKFEVGEPDSESL